MANTRASDIRAELAKQIKDVEEQLKDKSLLYEGEDKVMEDWLESSQGYLTNLDGVLANTDTVLDDKDEGVILYKEQLEELSTEIKEHMKQYDEQWPRDIPELDPKVSAKINSSQKNLSEEEELARVREYLKEDMRNYGIEDNTVEAARTQFQDIERNLEAENQSQLMKEKKRLEERNKPIIQQLQQEITSIQWTYYKKGKGGDFSYTSERAQQKVKQIEDTIEKLNGGKLCDDAELKNHLMGLSKTSVSFMEKWKNPFSKKPDEDHIKTAINILKPK